MGFTYRDISKKEWAIVALLVSVIVVVIYFCIPRSAEYTEENVVQEVEREVVEENIGHKEPVVLDDVADSAILVEDKLSMLEEVTGEVVAVEKTTYSINYTLDIDGELKTYSTKNGSRLFDYVNREYTRIGLVSVGETLTIYSTDGETANLLTKGGVGYSIGQLVGFEYLDEDIQLVELTDGSVLELGSGVSLRGCDKSMYITYTVALNEGSYVLYKEDSQETRESVLYRVCSEAYVVTNQE